MSFVSVPFLAFAAVVLLLYFLLPGRCRWLVLLAASLVFCASCGWASAVFVVASSLVAYLAGLRIAGLYEGADMPDTARPRCRRVLIAAAALLVAAVAWTKLDVWIVQSVRGLFSSGGKRLYAGVTALGISYYTFSLIGYLADVYWRKQAAEKNYLHLLLFSVYFPKLLMGPIARHQKLAPQLLEGHDFDYNRFCRGLQLMLWGYFKKMVVADRLALFVGAVFDNIAGESGAHLLIAAVFGAIQLYCDFSGCMDIAGGFSQCLGIELEQNFRRPFFSRSAAEFWRRWHITLGAWFRDYVFMPMAASPRLIGVSGRVRRRFGLRAGRAFMTAAPLFVVWLLTGLWHGTGWNYIVWGLYWGALIILSTVFAPEIKKLTKRLRINTQAGSWRVFQMARTFLLFVFGRILTIPGDLAASGLALGRIFTDFEPWSLVDGSLYELELDRPNFLFALISILVLWAVGMLQERGSVRDRIAGCNIVIRWGIYYAAVFAVLVFGIYGPGYDAASFVYMNY